MPSILVETREKQVITTTDNIQQLIHPAFVQHGDELQQLRDCLSFPQLDELEIRASLGFLPRYRPRLKLLPNVRQAICAFLMHYHAKQILTFDCRAFANLVAGMEQHPVSRLQNFWNLSACPLLPKPGDVLFFMRSREHLFCHAAIYLGFKLYISVYGAGGDLEFSRRSDMLRDFRATDVHLATPRHRTAIH